MAGQFTFYSSYVSCLIAILSAIAGIIVLWIPVGTFTARYSYIQAPTVFYAYDANRTTASCNPADKFEMTFTWWCFDQSSMATLAHFSDEYDNIRFSLISASGGNSYTVKTKFLEDYSTSTVPSSISSPTLTGASPTAAPTTVTVTATRHRRQYGEFMTTLPSILQGQVVSTITSAPTMTAFTVTPAHTKTGYRGYILFYQIVCLIVTIVSVILAGINTIRAWRFLKTREVPHEVDLNGSHARQRDEKSRPLPVEEEDTVHPNPPKPDLVGAWNELPESAITGLWWYFVIPVPLLGIVAVVLQGVSFVGLPAFLSAGACGRNSIDYTEWADRICNFDIGSFPISLTADPSNKAVNMGTYGWPLIAGLVLLLVLFLSTTFYYISMLVKVRETRKRLVGGVSSPCSGVKYATIGPQ